ncbi:MAG: vanadium-dependent haloperoxidase [Bacteroidota bacterium]|nr:vanadium-dependent haloperoxidase [Bacteroidota bacterium]
MKRNYSLLTSILISFFLVFSGCKHESRFTTSDEYKKLSKNPDLLHRSVKKLTDIMVYDIFSPPVASRVYAYPAIAAYEALIFEHPEQKSLAGQLNDLDAFPQPDPKAEYNFPLASIQAHITVGKALIFSEEKLSEFEEEIKNEFINAGIPEEVYNRSLDFGNKIAQHGLDWASKDSYKESRGFEKYTVTSEPGTWTPTPPAYMAAIEPSWNRVRPFVLDSASQFKPAAPPAYDLSEDSEFYKDLIYVYETSNNLTQEQKAIASFWDCNPFVMHLTGHVMFATKKISPGGHWMGITSIATKKANADFVKTAEAYALVAISLSDGFISCWDEKFRSKLVRPESVINSHINSDWEPLLQTPPFPEYPSGHSVISSSAATVLTNLFGDNFEFLDTSEEEYGLPARSFESFYQASQEAAVSRLYGGIHYMPAITNGVDQGLRVGNHIVNTIQTRNNAVAEVPVQKNLAANN